MLAGQRLPPIPGAQPPPHSGLAHPRGPHHKTGVPPPILPLLVGDHHHHGPPPHLYPTSYPDNFDIPPPPQLGPHHHPHHHLNPEVMGASLDSPGYDLQNVSQCFYAFCGFYVLMLYFVK